VCVVRLFYDALSTVVFLNRVSFTRTVFTKGCAAKKVEVSDAISLGLYLLLISELFIVIIVHKFNLSIPPQMSYFYAHITS
jgi:hypothetical protein